MTKKKRAIELFQKGLRVSEVARVLKVPYATVYNWCVRRAENGEKFERREYALEKYYEILKSNGLGEELKKYLLTMFHQKKTERVLSLHQFYKLKHNELEKAGVKVSKSRFYDLVKFFVVREFGSVSKLEKVRRNKTAHKYIAKQGSIAREKGLWELDGSGWTDEITGKNFSFLILMDSYSGYIIDFTWVENKEKEARHYNKAFDSLQVGYFLMRAFIEQGVPNMLRTDNEKILTSEYLKNALKELGVKLKRVVPGMPHLKLVERAIGSLKGYLKTVLALEPALPFSEAMKKAIVKYNREIHNFKHGFIRPIEHFEQGRRFSEEEIKSAFAEKIERVLRDNVIQIENQKYQLDLISERLGETGRLEKGIPVLCIRYLDDISQIEVFDRETGEFIGNAKLVSLLTIEKVSTIEFKESFSKDKRAKRRLAKLEEEASRIKGQIQPNGILTVLDETENNESKSNESKSNELKSNELENNELESYGPGILQIFAEDLAEG